jgi:hypothetical protein
MKAGRSIRRSRARGRWRLRAARLAVFALLLQTAAQLLPMPSMAMPMVAAAAAAPAAPCHSGVLDTGHAAPHADAAQPAKADPGPAGKPMPPVCQICLTLHMAGSFVWPAPVTLASPDYGRARLDLPPSFATALRFGGQAAAPRGPPAPV